MTVYELIQQLQECDKPDAVIRVRVATPKDRSGERSFELYAVEQGELATDVYYDSVSSNEVIIEAEVK